MYDELLDKIEIIEATSKRRRKKKKSISENTTIELPDLDPLTRRLVRLGLLDLKDVQKVLEVDKEAKESRNTDFSEHFSTLDRVEELGQIRNIITKAIEEKKNAKMIRIPFYVFRDVVPDVTWRDLERLAQELSEDSRVIRAVFEDAYLTVLISS